MLQDAWILCSALIIRVTKCIRTHTWILVLSSSHRFHRNSSLPAFVCAIQLLEKQRTALSWDVLFLTVRHAAAFGQWNSSSKQQACKAELWDWIWLLTFPWDHLWWEPHRGVQYLIALPLASEINYYLVWNQAALDVSRQLLPLFSHQTFPSIYQLTLCSL